MCFYRQLDNWMFGYFTCLGVGLRQTHVVQFSAALCLWRRMNTFDRMKGQNRVIKSFHRTAIAWPGVGGCPERDLHCGAEFLQKRHPRRGSHGCCHSAGVVLEVFDLSDSPELCKVQVLAKALESNHHVTHLNLERSWIDIKVRSLVWDPGFRRRRPRILQTFLIHSTYSSAVARRLFDSR